MVSRMEPTASGESRLGVPPPKKMVETVLLPLEPSLYAHQRISLSGKIAGRDRGFADGRGVKGAVQAAAAAEGDVDIDQHGSSAGKGLAAEGKGETRSSYFQNVRLTSVGKAGNASLSWQGESVRVYSPAIDIFEGDIAWIYAFRPAEPTSGRPI